MHFTIHAIREEEEEDKNTLVEVKERGLSKRNENFGMKLGKMDGY